MIEVINGKMFFQNKEISNELFALMIKDASEGKAITIDLKRLTILELAPA